MCLLLPWGTADHLGMSWLKKAPEGRFEGILVASKMIEGLVLAIAVLNQRQRSIELAVGAIDDVIVLRVVEDLVDLLLVAELQLAQLQDVLDANGEGEQEEDVGRGHEDEVLDDLLDGDWEGPEDVVQLAPVEDLQQGQGHAEAVEAVANRHEAGHLVVVQVSRVVAYAARVGEKPPRMRRCNLLCHHLLLGAFQAESHRLDEEAHEDEEAEDEVVGDDDGGEAHLLVLAVLLDVGHQVGHRVEDGKPVVPIYYFNFSMHRRRFYLKKGLVVSRLITRYNTYYTVL